MRRLRFPRLTFLARFTLVTLAAAILSASVLAVVLETIHQRAVENDEIVNSVGQINAKVSAPLERLEKSGPGDPVVVALFRAADQEALLHQFVGGLRVYRVNGTPVYPHDARADAIAVKAAAAGDNLMTVEVGSARTVYEPFVAGTNGRFVVAIDFLPDQLHAQFASERWQVILATISVIALIAAALIALAAGASRELERRRRESLATFVQTLTTLAETIDLRDPYTAGHSKRVAAYSRKLAEDLGLRSDEVDEIENSALLHDIGKIGVPDAVLFKAGPLDAEERLLIRGHPVVGAGLLRGIPTMDGIVPCILHHHERVDGMGYPDGLSGDEIPFGARVIAVADAFDAMTTDRPYRRGLTIDAAVEELLRQEKTQFDSRCVLAFAGLVVRGDIIPPPRATGDVFFAQRTVLERQGIT